MTDVREQLQRTLSGTYTVERELGGGGMSRVFVARDTTLERPVVVKVLSPELAAGVSAERFTRETKVAASLQQANIVPVLAAGVTGDGLPYYTMPFVEGQSLRSRLAKGGAMTITEVIGIMRDVSKALAYAHSHGIVHRDIKPDNVLISGGTAVVTDFGIAKALTAARTDAGHGTLTQLGTAIGTPAYMAPEQAAGDPDVDRRADIYSLGCLVYELLTGQSPFHGRPPARMMAAHMSEVPAHVSTHRVDTPVELASLVMRCLAKNADERPQNAQELVQTLDSVTSGGSMQGLPSILIGGPGMLKKALAFYAIAFIAVAVLARAAIIVIGLPDWVFPGALITMALGLPVILFTAYVYSVNRRVATVTPTFTPGGTPSLTHGTMASIAIKATPHVSWRRTAMGGTYALGAFVVVVGAFMSLRAMGIGPAGSLLAMGAINARERLLVTDFKVTNADSSLGRVLGDATKTTLAESKVITLATPAVISDALRRMRQPTSATMTFELARQMAIRNNIKAIVDGEVTGLGAAGFIVTLKLVTTDSMRELASFRESAADARGLIVAVDKLSRSMRAKIGESLRSVRATLPLFDATTGSMDALRKFTEGSRIAEIENDNNKAIPVLREAVTIDSTFASGWRKLAIVMSNAGRPRSSVDSALTKAFQNRDRLTDVERDYVDAAYYSNGPGRDRGKAIATYERMMARGDTSGPANNAALQLGSRREYARAESLYRAQERNCPGCFQPLYGNLGITLVRAGKLAEAESVGRAGLGRFPNNKALQRSPIVVQYLRGDSAGYRRSVDSILAKGDSSDKVYARFRQRLLALRDGRPAEYTRAQWAARTDTASASPRERLGWVINGDQRFISVLLERGKELEKPLDEALARVNFAQIPEAERPYVDIIATYADAGRTDKARQWYARFESEIKDTALRRDLAPQRASAMGDILFAEGKYEAALKEIRAADRKPDGPADACAICMSIRLVDVFGKLGETDSAIVHAERLIVEYSFDRWNLDWYLLGPLSKQLGELYERKGDMVKAAKYYRDFVNLWKNAEPELQPQVAEVRRRLSRMADIEQKKP
jgi:tetratricopeptide (TPR) repeat protein